VAAHLRLVPGGGDSEGQPGPEAGPGDAAPEGGGPPLVVFVGVGDDRRSRVAAALLEHRANGRVQVVSMSPATVPPDPVVARLLAPLGVDLRAQRSSPLSAELLRRAAAVVLMGYTGAELPSHTEDWCIDDPGGKDPQTVRYLLDALDRRVQRLLARLEREARPAHPSPTALRDRHGRRGG
jgi:protein-tyrosine-phosphatase